MRVRRACRWRAWTSARLPVRTSRHKPSDISQKCCRSPTLITPLTLVSGKTNATTHPTDVAADRRIVRNHIAYHGPIVIDARLKPWYPKELTAREDTTACVSARWKEYFPGGGVEMGDSERGHLD